METPDRIGSYTVRGVLGEGGMGTVYLAEHPVIGKKVAIKVLRRDLVGRNNVVHRFVNEARAVALVRHPGIVEVFDFGNLPDGVPFFVMEYLPGRNLAQRVAEGPRPTLQEALSIVFQTALALAAAHAKGIIHRDLKPANLFLVHDPAKEGGERVKVLDFGIAKLHAEPSQWHTANGSLMGTPVYMSPEQCRGVHDQVDHRTDIYSLGVILYELLCGQPPFKAEAFGDLLLNHMNDRPPAPSSFDRDIPPQIEQAILRALAKRREDRFASMHELVEALGGPRADEAAPPPLEPPPKEPAPPTLPLIPTDVFETPMAIQSASGRRRKTLGLSFGATILLGGGLLVLSVRRPPVPVTVPPTRVVEDPGDAPVGPADAAAVVRAAAPSSQPSSPSAAEATASTARAPGSAQPVGNNRKRVRRRKIEVQQW